MSAPPPTHHAPIEPLRWLNLALLAAWLWKSWAFPEIDRIYRAQPLVFDFFPSSLQAITTLEVAYLAPICVALGFAIRRTWPAGRVAALAWLAGSLALLLHLGSYNDATFTTSFWVALWMSWYAFRRPRTAGDWALVPPFVARCLISLVFLGGLVGKLTPEYWSGEAFFAIYDRPYGVFALARAYVTPSALPALAQVYSIGAIAMEGAAAASFLLPSRWAGLVTIAVMLSIVALSNLLLGSVMAPLIGLAATAWWLSRQAQPSGGPDVKGQPKGKGVPHGSI